MMTEQDTAIAKKWIKQALHDLEMAERNIGIEGYDITAFLSHRYQRPYPFEQYDANLAYQRIASAKKIFDHVSNRIQKITRGGS